MCEGDQCLRCVMDAEWSSKVDFLFLFLFPLLGQDFFGGLCERRLQIGASRIELGNLCLDFPLFVPFSGRPRFPTFEWDDSGVSRFFFFLFSVFPTHAYG